MRKFFVALLVLTCSLFCTACNTTGGSAEELLVGTWEHTNQPWGDFAYVITEHNTCVGLYFGNVSGVAPSLYPDSYYEGSGNGIWEITDDRLLVAYSGKNSGTQTYSFELRNHNTELWIYGVSTYGSNTEPAVWYRVPENREYIFIDGRYSHIAEKDTNGFVIEETYPTGKIITYERNKDGTVKSKTEIYQNEKSVTLYEDEKITFSYFYQNEILQSKSQYLYDLNDEREQRIVFFDGEGNYTGSRYTKYDDLSSTRTIAYYDAEDHFQYAYIHKLDENGNVIQSATRYADGSQSPWYQH